MYFLVLLEVYSKAANDYLCFFTNCKFQESAVFHLYLVLSTMVFGFIHPWFLVCEMCTKFWFENPAGKRPLRIPTHKWENNIKIDCKEKGWESMDWKHLAQDRGWWQALTNMVHVEKFSFVGFCQHQEIQICCGRGCDGIQTSILDSKSQFHCVFYNAFLYYF
jgi:hypothetical protein